jgi:hypothetical protein
MIAFWIILFFGVVALIGCLAAIDYGKDVSEVFYGMIIGAFLLLYAGYLYPKANNSCFIVESISQTRKGYIIDTNHFLRIFQKECSYKIGDTLWIKK